MLKRYITPNDPEVQSAAQEILDTPIRLDTFDQLREWVAGHISYKSDSEVHGVSDYWQLPAETLKLGTGDCEDIAILLCTLLRACGIPSDQVYVAAGCTEDRSSCHAYLVECYYTGIWQVIEPQAGAWISAFMWRFQDTFTDLTYKELCCFNDLDYFPGGPALPPGVYEFEVGNSFYPLDHGASKELSRYIQSGQMVSGLVEWMKEYQMVWAWDLIVHAPDGSTENLYSGTSLTASFNFIADQEGEYRIELLKRDSLPRCLRITLNSEEWTLYEESY
ncbi:transglutaminase family protein [Chloroflexota bacterium]